MAETRRHVLTFEEAVAFRDAATADELEAAARQARARWVAEALERLALDSLRYAATLTVRRADEYRAGTR